MANPAETYRKNIRTIIAGAPYNGFANFILQGRPDKMSLNTFAALYPHLSSSPYSGGVDYKCLAVVDGGFPEKVGLREHLLTVRHDILQLELPQRVIDLQEPGNPTLTKEVAMGFALVGLMPIAFIGVGETVQGDIEKMSVMWHIRTLTSQAALDMIKERLQAGLALGN